MEEVVGKIWDKWLTRQVSADHPAATVNLCDIRSQLLLFYRAMGGVTAKSIEIAEGQKLKVKRTTLQKVAGSHQKFSLAWQDERSVRLPASLAIFADKDLNEALYFWLVALAAKMPIMTHWLQDNQVATIKLMADYPGLKQSYLKLSRAYLAARPEPDTLSPRDRALEKQIQSALKVPGIVNHLPDGKYQPLPVSLWLYPPLTCLASRPDDKGLEQNNPGQRNLPDIKEIEQRKQVDYVDDERKTDGFMAFQAEALETWTEQVNLDRCQNEDDDNDNLDDIAKDLDIITLSRHRKAKAARIRFDLDLPAAENDDLRLGEGIPLPEWNFKQQRLVENSCFIQTMLADDVKPVPLSQKHQLLSREVSQLFLAIGLNRTRRKAQATGDELDLDAWISEQSRPVKDSSKQNYFIDSRDNFRDVNCLILADLSLSTEGHINNEQKVIDVIRDSLIVFSEALNQLNDEFAIYGFSSVRSQHVRYHILKNFNMRYNDHVRGRISRIEPGYYTRMGAAIRQSSKLLLDRGADNKILLLLTDGRPNDLDQYEGRYGLEDTRQAIIEARQAGLVPYCVTIDQKAHDYLPFLFGHNGFAIVNDATQLPKVLPKIYLNLTKN
ncbi:VWA domain-containing protein [Thalassomonas sp. RHCl1]|uniref:nitric oxide reductase activation protein NorD n=1 Tax=Thalassomonas sp. RHCl1 TaxID=2995320 RepID=UPI00248D1AB8|nr:VWA domain-containing protein [Thalassomonas sp. RHCl1]